MSQRNRRASAERQNAAGGSDNITIVVARHRAARCHRSLRL